jgi:hypothetical protein
MDTIEEDLDLLGENFGLGELGRPIERRNRQLQKYYLASTILYSCPDYKHKANQIN